MKVAYVSAYNARDVRHWSGLGRYIAESLEQQSLALDYVGPLKSRYPVLTAAKKAYYRMRGQRYLAERDPLVVRGYAHQVASQLVGKRYDAVFSPGTLPLVFLECCQPMAFWADANFAAMVDFYPAFSHLAPASFRDGMALEQQALERVRLAIYASDWAAQAAMKYYRVNPSKVHVVPFGANIECERTWEEVERLVRSRPKEPCKLLFLGVDWHRKGGEVALRIASELNERGLKTILTVMGCDPELISPPPSYVRLLGFVSKATAEGRAAIDQALAESHFLLLPSRSEAYGLVFVEANSFGVPSLATNVGGIPTIIRNGVNGWTFPPDAPVDRYCDCIATLMQNDSEYLSIARSSFNEYETRLNWQVAGCKVKRLLESVLAEK